MEICILIGKVCVQVGVYVGSQGGSSSRAYSKASDGVGIRGRVAIQGGIEVGVQRGRGGGLGQECESM